MSLAWRELVRRPGRFAVAGTALTLLVVLLFLLGGLLDGLFLGSTGAIRAIGRRGDAFVFSADARSSFLRSRIGPDLRARIEATPGVEAVDGIGFTLLGARRTGADPDADVLDVAVAGYEGGLRGRPAPPPPGRAWADDQLRDEGVEVGDVLAVGPGAVPLEVAGFVDDSSYLLQGSLWVEPDTWRGIQSSARPDATVADGVFQALVVRGAPDDVGVIDQATDGATDSLTRDDAVFSLPGTRQQNSTFTALIAVTLLVAGLVSALFFALLTLERTSTYAILKAIGAPSRQLVAGVVLQAVVVAAGAVALGLLLTLGLEAVIPRGIPVRLEPSRLVTSAVLVVLTGAAGGLLSLRRIVRIDPATAIG